MFITFEGPEGAGKSTVVAAVAEVLRAKGLQVVTTREPGEGSVGLDIRRILLHGEELDPKTELFLFLADRAQHVADMIRPALAEGKVVICDRYADSTVVYQGCARGFERDSLRRWNRFATSDLTPDLTILLDLPAEVGLARVRNKDRLDSEPIEFHRKVRQGFLDEAAREPLRWRIVDADRPVAEVVAEVLDQIDRRAS